jgi:succinoglycan biosynthesis protein ExoO
MDNQIPDVSVIITSYNVENYIERAINSALQQQGATLEVIVVDDCSTDNTWSIICKNTDVRIKPHRLEKNGGPSVARNFAIEQATGKWIAILDGDDVFLPDRLARCLKLANEKQADIVVDNIAIYREIDKKQSLMFPTAIFSAIGQLNLATFLLEKVAGSKYTLGYLKPIFSLEFLRKHLITYDANIRIGEDYIFFANALASGAVCVVEQEAGYQYTVRAGSISHRLSLTDIENILAADAKFASQYTLDKASRKAQERRRINFKKEYYALIQVNALKRKDILEFLKIVYSYPAATTLLLRPIKSRIMKLFL